ncbi:hypothetical protein JY742_10255 [Clostridioides difficile]|nr:hypothetical protein [Clostridioides difficile]
MKVWIDAGEFLENIECKEHISECSLSEMKNINNQRGQGRKNKKIECFNTKTGEIKIFSGGIEASEYLNVSLSYISRLAKEKKTNSYGWKVRYI